jgi:hypothetical protein
MDRRKFLTAVGALAVGAGAMGRLLPEPLPKVSARDWAVLMLSDGKVDGGFLVPPEYAEHFRNGGTISD